MKHMRARWDEAILCSGRISSSMVVGLNITARRVGPATMNIFFKAILYFCRDISGNSAVPSASLRVLNGNISSKFINS